MTLLQYLRLYAYPHLPSWHILHAIFPLYLQAVLLHPKQTPTIRFLRLALAPITIYYAILILLRPEMDFTPRPAFRAYNFIKNVACPSLSARAIEYGLAKDRLQWIGYDEADKARKKGHSSNQRNTDLRAVDGSANAGRSETDSAPAFGWASLWFGLCQASTLRGIGYDWGIKGQLIPQSFTPQNFIREYLFMVLRAHILLILAITACQIYFRSSESDFLRSLGVSGLPLQSIMSRICLGIVFGSAVWNFLDLAYACLALFAKLGTATLQKLPLLPEIFKPAPFNPRAWPPLLRNPLVSDNLADFWTYRWHSILRRAFVVTGYKPARYATQRLGSQVSTLFGVMGAFLASGILHESAIYFATIELPFDRSLASLRFFMLQGIGLVAEQIFSQATGRSVGGWLGRMWIVAMLAYPAGGLAHAWIGRDLITHMPMPTTWEWWRWIPMLSYVPRLTPL